MEKSKVAAVLYPLIREQAKKSPRVVAAALIAPGTWAIRADFDDGRRDYRYARGGPLEEVPGGFASWPPPAAMMDDERATVHEMPPRHAAKK